MVILLVIGITASMMSGGRRAAPSIQPDALIVNAAGVTWLDQSGGAPLSIDNGRPRTNAVVDVDDADVLVLYTDGLIERRGESLDIGLDRLSAGATELYGSTVHRFADGLLRLLSPETTRDDVVVVVKQLASTPRSPVFS